MKGSVRPLMGKYLSLFGSVFFGSFLMFTTPDQMNLAFGEELRGGVKNFAPTAEAPGYGIAESIPEARPIVGEEFLTDEEAAAIRNQSAGDEIGVGRSPAAIRNPNSKVPITTQKTADETQAAIAKLAQKTEIRLEVTRLPDYQSLARLKKALWKILPKGSWIYEKTMSRGRVTLSVNSTFDHLDIQRFFLEDERMRNLVSNVNSTDPSSITVEIRPKAEGE